MTNTEQVILTAMWTSAATVIMMSGHKTIWRWLKWNFGPMRDDNDNIIRKGDYVDYQIHALWTVMCVVVKKKCDIGMVQVRPVDPQKHIVPSSGSAFRRNLTKLTDGQVMLRKLEQ